MKVGEAVDQEIMRRQSLFEGDDWSDLCIEIFIVLFENGVPVVEVHPPWTRSRKMPKNWQIDSIMYSVAEPYISQFWRPKNGKFPLFSNRKGRLIVP